MSGDAADLIVQLTRDSTDRWLTLRLAVGDDAVLEMVPNPGFPRTVISQRAADDLTARGMIAPGRRRDVTLRNLRIEGQQIPDLVVRVSPIGRILGVDGILGFDFIQRYTGVYLDVPALRLTLIDP